MLFRSKLLDFGISKVLDDPAGVGQHQTQEGTIMGTPFFMAPEQVNGEPVDARTDIWAVGVILYFLVTAALPFEGTTTPRTLASVLAREPRPPSQRVPSIPAGLEAVILQCLQKTPAHRPATVSALAEALAPFADEGPLPRASRTSRASLRVLSTAPLHDDVHPSNDDGAAHPPPDSEAPRRRWLLPVMIAVCFGVACLSAALAPRSPEASPPPRDMETRAVARVELPAPASAARELLPADSAPPHRAAPSAVAPSPPAVSASVRPVVVPRAAGFDLGSRH